MSEQDIQNIRYDNIRYALAKQVPDMHRGFTISTNYGDIVIPAGKASGLICECVERVLQNQLPERAKRTTKKATS